MKESKVILDGKRFDLTIKRLCAVLAENHDDFQNSCLVGIQRTGVPLMNRLGDELKKTFPDMKLLMGKLDVTFYRDDVRRGKDLQASPTNMDFLVEGKKVILIDDVLYTGRTVRAALDALLHYGRPKQVEFLTLIDRRFSRDLPIQADYIGMVVDTLNNSHVRVEWGENPSSDRVMLESGDWNVGWT